MAQDGVLAAKAMGTQGKGGAVAAKAVGTRGKGGAVVAKAVEMQKQRQVPYPVVIVGGPEHLFGVGVEHHPVD